MLCNICGEEANPICLCGFCMGCIKKYGHDGCYKILEERKKDEIRGKIVERKP